MNYTILGLIVFISFLFFGFLSYALYLMAGLWIRQKESVDNTHKISAIEQHNCRPEQILLNLKRTDMFGLAIWLFLFSVFWNGISWPIVAIWREGHRFPVAIIGATFAGIGLCLLYLMVENSIQEIVYKFGLLEIDSWPIKLGQTVECTYYRTLENGGNPPKIEAILVCAEKAKRREPTGVMTLSRDTIRRDLDVNLERIQNNEYQANFSLDISNDDPPTMKLKNHGLDWHIRVKVTKPGEDSPELSTFPIKIKPEYSS
ncbi:MAG: hypothetical protein ABEJ65_02625 [bacterium]